MTVIALTYTISLAEITGSANSAKTPFALRKSTNSMLLSIYLRGVTIFLLRTIISYSQLLLIIRNSETHTVDGIAFLAASLSAKRQQNEYDNADNIIEYGGMFIAQRGETKEALRK